MKRIAYFFILILLAAPISLFLSVYSRMDIETKIVGSLHQDIWIIPQLAGVSRFLLRHFVKIPTDRVGPSGQNLVQFTLAGYDESLSPTERESVLDLADYFITSGVDVNYLAHGYSALHSAILLQSPEVIKFLLSHGADPKLKTKTKSGASNNLSALELCRFLAKKNPTIDYQPVLEALQTRKE